METITGLLERITYENDTNGYRVVHIRCRGLKDLVCVVGTFPPVSVGEMLECQGTWKLHPSHGRQFEVTACQVSAPSTLIGIKKYLSGGLIKGIGPTYAEKIVDHFGLDTLDVIEHAPERLKEVKGLGQKRIDKITSCWQEQRKVRDVMIFLQGHGVSPAFAQKIFRAFGSQSIQKVQENPYALAREVHGIGFKTADAIAANLGIAKTSCERLKAALEFSLEELQDEGHTCFPEDKLIEHTAKLLELDPSLLPSPLDELIQEGRIERFPLYIASEKVSFLWLKPLFFAEVSIANDLNDIKNKASNLREVDCERALDWVQKKLKINLAEAQKKAVAEALKQKLLVITGGPGTGKSTITKAILEILGMLTDKILLAAPTGRAAKRMSEICGRKAQTIHSLLEVDFKTFGFKRGRSNPLDCDLLIVDEASMIDTFLMSSLLKAVPRHARLIFVGDIHQLPSVGPGSILQDIIASMQIPVCTLNEIFRQAQGSNITINAHKINRGQVPSFENDNESDYFFLEAEEPEKALAELVKLVALRLPKKYDFHPIRDIQVLAPMKRGMLGIENINQVLQEQLNPSNDPLFKAGRRFHVGDKVMQIQNNYEKIVFNGDVGVIRSFDRDEESVIVDFEGNLVEYEFHDLDELTLAYAVSVHKYQGSECPCVIMVVHTSHFKLLQRNLLYTGVTRGKKLVLLLGSKKAVCMAVANDEVKERYTGLKSALLGTMR